MTELSRPVVLDRIGAAGAVHVVEARPDELGPLAHRLMIPAVNRLWCEFRLRRGAGAVIAAEGRLEAEVVQVCVLTLDEFAQPVHETFQVEFVPAGSESEDDDPESPDQIPYEAGVVDLGEAAAEQLALALDPYPKKPGATEQAIEQNEEDGPFAALAALRRKR
ncbi:MAG TPA: YceD family protein [Acetobacteraceae bacterium]|nr:YceD family protein [Acetobacteraceae bacterium]